LAGRGLIDHAESTSELFCRYQSNPQDFFCKYFINTGLLKQDHDQGFCPPVADVDCSAATAARKASRIPRSPAPPSPVSRDVNARLREVKARLMKTRNDLGKKKRRA
jgi:hypothetical protein